MLDTLDESEIIVITTAYDPLVVDAASVPNLRNLEVFISILFSHGLLVYDW
ncbi:MAG: hypothetical protein IPG53_16065 [Ignavibacteriales bacterium]|nr:hypothetical protein [Ignavibacteriales bacterium]